jgi:hypothetical protein
LRSFDASEWHCCCIDPNSASDSGGTLYAAEGSSIGISNDSIISNSTSKWGGGVCLRDNTSFTCRDSQLLHNTAASGGGINMQETAVARLQKGCSVLFNNATSEGGGIHATSEAKVQGSVRHPDV